MHPPPQTTRQDAVTKPHRSHPTMAGGSLAQAKHRSSASSTEAMNPVQINGQSLMLIVPEPNQEELLAEIPQKAYNGIDSWSESKTSHRASD